MSKYQPGTRVGAILKADEKTVHLLGYGTYDGDLEPPFRPFGFTKEEYQMKAKELFPDKEVPTMD
jgi:hypothetical protein